MFGPAAEEEHPAAEEDVTEEEAGPVVDNRDRQAACGIEVGAAERVENGGERCRKSGCIAVEAPGFLGHCNTTGQRPDTGRRREVKLETAWSQLMMIDTETSSVLTASRSSVRSGLGGGWT